MQYFIWFVSLFFNNKKKSSRNTKNIWNNINHSLSIYPSLWLYNKLYDLFISGPFLSNFPIKHKMIKRNREPRLKKEKKMLPYLTERLVHFNNLDIVHRDIKPTIVISLPLFDKNPHIKFANLWVSKIFKMVRNDFTNTNLIKIETRGWMPPELFKRERFHFNVDVWALDCTFVYILKVGKTILLTSTLFRV